MPPTVIINRNPVRIPLPHEGKPHTYARNMTRRLRFKFWYDAIIDWMLCNPDKTLKQCAKDLGRNVDTIYMITSSDIFKSRLASRRQELNTRLAEGIAEATSDVALSAMNEIRKRIIENPAKIPTVVLNDIAAKALDRLGYGVQPVSPITINTGPTLSVSTEVLNEAKLAMRQAQQMNAQIVEEPSSFSRKADDVIPLEDTI